MKTKYTLIYKWII